MLGFVSYIRACVDPYFMIKSLSLLLSCLIITIKKKKKRFSFKYVFSLWYLRIPERWVFG
jgi:hypothetical protein